jgi:hypothetical protein
MNTQHGLHVVGEWARSRTGLVTIALLALAGFVLIMEHYAHIVGLLPFALLLLCPLMMLFMHGGHGDHSGHDQHHETNSHAESHTHHQDGL